MWSPVDPLVKDTIVGKKSPDSTSQNVYKIIKLPCTVGANNKFTFHLHSTVILQCDCY